MVQDPRERDPSVLKLHVSDLRSICDALERLAEAKITFDGALRVGGHRVHVRWVDSPRDDSYVVVTKITSE